MELTSERKQQIENEEQQRLAEEQYRAKVRAGLIREASPVNSTSKESPLRLFAVVIAVCIGVVICAIALPKLRQSVSAASAGGSSVASGVVTTESARASSLETPSPVRLTTAQIAQLATPSVVVVQNYSEDGEKAGQGSGYVFSSDGVVVTNYHVVRGAKSLAIRAPSGGGSQQRVDFLLGYSVEHDVAALQISGGSLPALSTETSEKVKVGDHVVAIGAPLGLESTVSEGIVSAVREAAGGDIIQTTASISPGSSGGPLLNHYGKVVGVTTAMMLNGQNLNFVIPSRYITELLGAKREMSLADMLSETQVTDSLPASTIPVAARNVVQLPFAVNGQQGAVLEGSYTVSGGRGSDIGVMLIGLGGAVIVNSGRVSRSGQFRQRLPRGQYAVIFDNRFSTFSAKSVSPDLKLVYYR